MRAYEILQRYQHTQVDTEHLFLALLEQANGIVPQILDRLAVPVNVVSGKLDEVLAQGGDRGVRGRIHGIVLLL